jgi:type I restriction enzyme S subunit
MKVLRLTDSQDHISVQAIEESSVKLLPPNSLLMVVRGMILMHSFPVALTTVDVVINQDMKALIPFDYRIIEYILLLLRGMKEEFLELIERSSHGTCRMPTDALLSLLLPFPPLAEQKRIVAKVDELMALCDQLECHITRTQTVNTHLMESLIHSVTGPGSGNVKPRLNQPRPKQRKDVREVSSGGFAEIRGVVS